MIRAFSWLTPLLILLVVIAVGSVVVTHAAGVDTPPIHPNMYWPG